MLFSSSPSSTSSSIAPTSNTIYMRYQWSLPSIKSLRGREACRSSLYVVLLSFVHAARRLYRWNDSMRRWIDAGMWSKSTQGGKSLQIQPCKCLPRCFQMSRLYQESLSSSSTSWHLTVVKPCLLMVLLVLAHARNPATCFLPWDRNTRSEFSLLRDVAKPCWQRLLLPLLVNSVKNTVFIQMVVWSVSRLSEASLFLSSSLCLVCSLQRHARITCQTNSSRVVAIMTDRDHSAHVLIRSQLCPNARNRRATAQSSLVPAASFYNDIVKGEPPMWMCLYGGFFSCKSA